MATDCNGTVSGSSPRRTVPTSQNPASHWLLYCYLPGGWKSSTPETWLWSVKNEWPGLSCISAFPIHFNQTWPSRDPWGAGVGALRPLGHLCCRALSYWSQSQLAQEDPCLCSSGKEECAQRDPLHLSSTFAPIWYNDYNENLFSYK